jgi:hypothetical protein
VKTPMPSEMTRLRLNSHGGIAVEDARDILLSFEQAYNSISRFDSFVAAVQQIDQYIPLPRQNKLVSLFGYELLGYPGSQYFIDPFFDAVPLELSAVQLASPGFWEFVGALSPLETIRDYVNDRHERIKDKEWRDDILHRKAEHENTILENQAVRERIDILRSLGYTDDEIRSLTSQQIVLPLRGLGKLQDRHLIEDATVALAEEVQPQLPGESDEGDDGIPQ